MCVCAVLDWDCDCTMNTNEAWPAKYCLCSKYHERSYAPRLFQFLYGSFADHVSFSSCLGDDQWCCDCDWICSTWLVVCCRAFSKRGWNPSKPPRTGRSWSPALAGKWRPQLSPLFVDEWCSSKLFVVSPGILEARTGVTKRSSTTANLAVAQGGAKLVPISEHVCWTCLSYGVLMNWAGEVGSFGWQYWVWCPTLSLTDWIPAQEQGLNKREMHFRFHHRPQVPILSRWLTVGESVRFFMPGVQDWQSVLHLETLFHHVISCPFQAGPCFSQSTRWSLAGVLAFKRSEEKSNATVTVKTKGRCMWRYKGQEGSRKL